MMLTRRTAFAGVTALIAAGAALAGGGSAVAVAPQGSEHPVVRSTAVETGQGTDGRRTAHRPTDPWIADQVAMFLPPSSGTATVFDPWVKDQIALFRSTLNGSPSK
ncbi:hypothetical protein [Streptomyces cyanogenus]|uniref:Uncharacterized protein n=1 Tax=Streptomyces cyanogenus TaxID=80860 RepID=A0ABX7TLU8_STRCY|nr:hypothetical protein [Streptomyces cyanogenus]QTD96568.1 hypothetical protein S1361_04360 [Streptomyces cyanogenus]